MKLSVKDRSVKGISQLEGRLSKEKESLVFWACIVFVVFFLFVAPNSYKTGPALFNGYNQAFEGRIYGAIIWGAIFLLVLSIKLWNNWRLRDWKDILSIAVWTIPLFYVLSLIPAVSRQYSTNMVLISTLYAIFFLLWSYLTQSKLGATIIQLAIVVSGYYIVLYGYMNMFGNVFYSNAVMFDQGLRITSVFQYANAYAAFLMAIFFAGLYLVVSTRKWYWVLANSLMLVPIMSSFWLTQSRGAYVMLPLIFVLIQPFVSFLRQLQMSLYLIASVILGVTLTQKFIAIATPINTTNAELYRTGQPTITHSIFSDVSFGGWERLIVVSAILAACITALHQFVIPFIVEKFKHKQANKNLTIFFPVGLVMLGVISVILLVSDTGVTKLLPESLRIRVETINFKQHSVLERGTFYNDAFKLVKAHPFGAGGGGWSAMYEKYQNNPYISNQAHNFPLQYLVEVGFIGFVASCGFLGLLYFLYYRKFFNRFSENEDPRLVFYIVSLAIMVHSLLDFDLSYVYLASLVFLCFGGMAAAIPFAEINWRRKQLILSLRWVFPGLVSVIGLIILIVATINFNADRDYKRANSAIIEGKPYEEITTALDNALNLKPYHPEFLQIKINLMLQGYDQLKDESFYNQALEYTMDIRKHEPFNRQGLEYEYKLYSLKKETVKMHDLLLVGLQNIPWDTPVNDPNPLNSRESYYERLLKLDLELGVKAIDENNTVIKEKYFSEAKQTYALIQEKTAKLLTLPEGQGKGRDFGVTAAMQAAMEQINLYEQKPETKVK